MSAAYWRRAMNTAAASAVRPLPTAPVATAGAPSAGTPRWLAWLMQHIAWRHVLVLLGVLLYPFVATPFFTYQIGAQALALGLIALSLTFLGGYGGMVSLAQMTVAGMAGYMVAIFGSSSAAAISLGWPWWLAVAVAIVIAVVFGTLVGWLSVRTEGIYTIMITLAIGVAFFYLAQQNYTLFNGFQGFNKVFAPSVLELDFREPVPFYFLTLGCALAGYAFVKLLVRAPFGAALQGIRDNPRRMRALGFDVTAHKVAAYFYAGAIAGLAGVLLVWFNGRISPGTVNVAAAINVLIIAVIGGMRHPIGPFIGAVVVVLMQTFAIDIMGAERFNTLIGLFFLVIVFISPDGLLGLWGRIKPHLAQESLRSGP